MEDQIDQQKIEWYIDLSVRNKDNKVVPSVILDVTDIDGNRESFNITLQKFHELRFQFASAMREMHKIDELLNEHK